MQTSTSDVRSRLLDVAAGATGRRRAVAHALVQWLDSRPDATPGAFRQEKARLVALERPVPDRSAGETMPFLRSLPSGRQELIVPSTCPSRYRWWDETLPETQRLTICAVLRELEAGPELHRAYCPGASCSVEGAGQ